MRGVLPAHYIGKEANRIDDRTQKRDDLPSKFPSSTPIDRSGAMITPDDACGNGDVDHDEDEEGNLSSASFDDGSEPISEFEAEQR